ncbi:MAG TPA: Gfo/Idh/MocA family oxidoreductase [Sedimentisphaerales bacterium]|nr:Gfo/Idh/MocA family oxidoreductase [Sedimentisphaerales bacterium]HRS11728.1 Gfo/Idh/MocA family oxidoreductase [Sedimentisphaerales bacterium]HRV48392.1 Gfo/Idh/MocA family oxidoreductase [Sedimentisphaerales bacterium]
MKNETPAHAKNRTPSNMRNLSRRSFLRNSAVWGAALALPTIVPSSVFGASAPSERITVGCIGVGRMGTGDLREALGFPQVQVVAVCDVDSHRLENARKLVEARYRARSGAASYQGCATYGDFRELLARADIDAVQIVTPDHWHAIPTVDAARAGKDIFLQKPLSLTLEEGRIISDTVRRYGRVFQIGSQQRSDSRFRKACELVRNGRVGKLHTVKVGFGIDPGCEPQPVMPVPEWLDYDMWLGPAPWAPYTEKRVHPEKIDDRPGWLRISDYSAGMITGWGSHHNDIAHWGMGTELTGPVEIEGRAEFPKEGLWDVHGRFHIEYTYANGVRVICADEQENKSGVVFEGDAGWVHVTRGFIDAQPKSLLEETIGPDETKLYVSNNHKANFYDCVKSRAETIAPVEVAHRSCSVCLLGDIAMRLGRKLRWDPDKEQFLGDEQATRMMARTMRSPWHL